MLSRRDVIQKMAVGTAATGAAVLAARSTLAAIRPATDKQDGDARKASATDPSTQAQPILDSDQLQTAQVPPAWSLIRPLSQGSAVANGWRVAALTGVVDGACVLTLENERGRTHRVHICRNDGKPQGLVATRNFDLLVMNGGQNDVPTDEGFARAVAKVGRILERNEGHDAALVTAMLPHTERVRRFSGEIDRRLR